MLSQKFPPPHIPNLCQSINPDHAVAQGLALEAALRSNLVPKHELRNIMMMDALPHDIGVLLSTSTIPDDEDNKQIQEEERFVTVLKRDSLLPSQNYCTFELSSPQQQGVTIMAAEYIFASRPSNNDDPRPQEGHRDRKRNPFEVLGTFTFLLHKLTPLQLQKLHNQNRSIDVGMTVDTHGKFTVSIFDEHDPEHLEKKFSYQQQHQVKGHHKKKYNDNVNVYKQEQEDENLLENDGRTATPQEQIYLTTVCIIVFFLYLFVRVLFNELEVEEL